MSRQRTTDGWQLVHIGKNEPDGESVDAFLARGGEIVQLNPEERGQPLQAPRGTLCRPKVQSRGKRRKLLAEPR